MCLGIVRPVRYRLAIFDFDGTLADSFPWFLQVFDELAEEFNLARRTREEYEAARGFDTPQILKMLGLPLWKVPRFVMRLRALAERDFHKITLFEGVPEMLRRLRSDGMKVAIVSSNSEAAIRRVLGPKHATEVTRYACGASMFGKASKLRTTLRLTNTQPQEAIYIGDEIRDAVAARAAKIDFGAVAWGYTTTGALEAQKPAFLFRSVRSIPEQLGS